MRPSLPPVSGLSFGIISGVFSVINILADALGPGVVGIHGDSPYYFLTSGKIHFSSCLHVLLIPALHLIYCICSPWETILAQRLRRLGEDEGCLSSPSPSLQPS